MTSRTKACLFLCATIVLGTNVHHVVGYDALTEMHRSNQEVRDVYKIGIPDVIGELDRDSEKLDRQVEESRKRAQKTYDENNKARDVQLQENRKARNKRREEFEKFSNPLNLAQKPTPSNPNGAAAPEVSQTPPESNAAKKSQLATKPKRNATPIQPPAPSKAPVEDPSRIPVSATILPLPPVTNAPIASSVRVKFKDGHEETMLQSTYEWKYKTQAPLKDAFNKTDFGGDCGAARKEVGDALLDDYADLASDMTIAATSTLAGHPEAGLGIAGTSLVKPLLANTYNGKIPMMLSQCQKPMGELVRNYQVAQESYPTPQSSPK